MILHFDVKPCMGLSGGCWGQTPFPDCRTENDDIREIEL